MHKRSRPPARDPGAMNEQPTTEQLLAERDAVLQEFNGDISALAHEIVCLRHKLRQAREALYEREQA